ncbi:hypothetical protein BKA66DRAFT_243977 [Pyrenochaeta sp. MPI-SDFR-AT-0127]|nr:hypothetical protein BKA66DRAFT_243977 [Pyrenochaeta sp. MPI-SDFR-AT-0127]
MEACIKEAKLNLADRTLPPYYFMKNCILVTSALDNRDDAETYRLFAEQQYRKSLSDAKRRGSIEDLALLQKLRKELDQLEDFKNKDLSIAAALGESYLEDKRRAQEDIMAMRAMGYDDELEFEDYFELVTVENENEVVAENMDLLPVTEDSQSPVPTSNIVSPSEPPANTIPYEAMSVPVIEVASLIEGHLAVPGPLPLRRKASGKLKKGEPAQSHEFSTSLGSSK